MFHSFRLRIEWFSINNSFRFMDSGVSSTFAFFMKSNPLFQISSVTRIVTSILAKKNIHVKFHWLIAPKPIMSNSRKAYLGVVHVSCMFQGQFLEPSFDPRQLCISLVYARFEPLLL